MAYLVKPKKRKRIKSQNDKIQYHKYYNCQRWRTLRDYKIMYTPLCQICNSKGKTKLAGHVHHMTPISVGINDRTKEILAYDIGNLLSVCITCHQEIHKLLKKDYEKYYKLMNRFMSKII